RFRIWGLASEMACLALIGEAGSKAGANTVAFDATGGLLASASDDGVRLWDGSRARQLASLPIGMTVGLHFHPKDGDLITSGGDAGVRRWPIHHGGQGGSDPMRVGPPRRIGPRTATHGEWTSLDADGAALVVAFVNSGRVSVLDLRTGREE